VTQQSTAKTIVRDALVDDGRPRIEEIVIGKDVLELVSSAMYVDPLTVYREYIQNAADAVDDAKRRGEIPKGKALFFSRCSHRRERVDCHTSGKPYPIVVNYQAIFLIDRQCDLSLSGSKNSIRYGRLHAVEAVLYIFPDRIPSLAIHSGRDRFQKKRSY
jgi:hypothetical protein